MLIFHSGLNSGFVRYGVVSNPSLYQDPLIEWHSECVQAFVDFAIKMQAEWKLSHPF